MPAAVKPVTFVCPFEAKKDLCQPERLDWCHIGAGYTTNHACMQLALAACSSELQLYHKTRINQWL